MALFPLTQNKNTPSSDVFMAAGLGLEYESGKTLKLSKTK